MKGILGILALAAAMLFLSIGQGQSADTGASEPVKSAALAGADQIVPLIEFRDVPISTAIFHLANSAGINYLIDPHLSRVWNDATEPYITFKVHEVSPLEMLRRILETRHLALLQNPYTTIARITAVGQSTNAQITALLEDLATNTPDSLTNGVLPTIHLAGVPLDIALDNLMRQSKLKFQYDPRLMNSASTNVSPTSVPDTKRASGLASKPSVSVRWTNVTAVQGIFALCENNELTITRDAGTGVLQIKPAENREPH